MSGEYTERQIQLIKGIIDPKTTEEEEYVNKHCSDNLPQDETVLDVTVPDINVEPSKYFSEELDNTILEPPMEESDSKKAEPPHKIWSFTQATAEAMEAKEKFKRDEESIEDKEPEGDKKSKDD